MARAVPRRDAISEIRHLLEQHRPFAHCDGYLALRVHISLAEGRAAASRLAGEPGFKPAARRVLHVPPRHRTHVHETRAVLKYPGGIALHRVPPLTRF
jgi:hypothetical protein